MTKKHSHYFRNVQHLDAVDVYRVLALFDVTDQAIGHAIKKLLVAGGRGVKDIDRDIQEAIDTLVRWQEMRQEDAACRKDSSSQPQQAQPPASKSFCRCDPLGIHGPIEKCPSCPFRLDQ